MAWNKVAVVGAGLIKMGELFEQSYEQMAAGAFRAAVEAVDKGFEPSLVEAAFVATQRGTLWGQEGIGGNTVPSAIGLAGIPCTRIENACPSGSDAFRVGAMAVASGVHDVVLVIGVEKMRDKSAEEGLLSRAAAGHPILTRGETAPVLFAPFATRHMAEFGTTREMLASVAV
jgi:acetyl-CoA C-acetyltransferase